MRNQEKTLEIQHNILSENLRRIHRMDEIFFPVFGIFLYITTATILFTFINTSLFRKLIVYGIGLVISLTGYIILHTQHKSFPMKIFYTTEGIKWINHRGKKVFIPWEDIIDVKPIGDYGKILGYGNGKVPDYILFFRKPFPGFTPVSKEVAEKIMEYMEKYKKFKIEGGDR